MKALPKRRTARTRRIPAHEIAQRPHCLVSAVLPDPIVLTRTQSYSIGRDPSADVQIRTDKVSRKHAEIWWDGRCFVVCDKGSTNGSALNDHKLGPEPTPLYDGDRLLFGGYEVTVNVLEPGELPEPKLDDCTRRIKLRPKA